MKVVLSLSGGLDSTVLLAHLLDVGHTVRALSIDYGQRHRRELQAAERIAAHYGVEWFAADLSSLRPLFAGSSQTDDAVRVPFGHYTDASMKVTVVPNRNMLFLAVAGAWAFSTDSDAVAYAAHAGDHAIYPDCRPEFVLAMVRALRLAGDRPDLMIDSPFVTLNMSKADIVTRGTALGVPFALTYSCYLGGADHCGQCGTCYERREAFTLAGVEDPTPYAALV